MTSKCVNDRDLRVLKKKLPRDSKQRDNQMIADVYTRKKVRESG